MHQAELWKHFCDFVFLYLLIFFCYRVVELNGMGSASESGENSEDGSWSTNDQSGSGEEEILGSTDDETQSEEEEPSKPTPTKQPKKVSAVKQPPKQNPVQAGAKPKPKTVSTDPTPQIETVSRPKVKTEPEPISSPSPALALTPPKPSSPSQPNGKPKQTKSPATPKEPRAKPTKNEKSSGACASVEFRTLLVFTKDLHRCYFLKTDDIFTALVSSQINFVVIDNPQPSG